MPGRAPYNSEKGLSKTEGFIPIPRKLVNSAFWEEKCKFNKRDAAVDLYQMARYSDLEAKRIIGGKVLSWGKNQLPASVRFLAERWMWSKDKVQKFLYDLQTEGFIFILQKSGQTVIEVIFEENESKTGQENGQPSGRAHSIPVGNTPNMPDTKPDSISDIDQDTDQDSDQDKTERKKKEGVIKSKKDIDYAFEDMEFQEAYNDWFQHRKDIRKPMTQLSMAKDKKFLIQFTAREAIDVINTSIRSGYQGLFAPRTMNTNTNNHANSRSYSANAGGAGVKLGTSEGRLEALKRF